MNSERIWEGYNIRNEFWYAVIGMFLLVFLVPFVPFEILTFIEFILLAVTGYFYWQDQKEKEERLRYLEEEERRRRQREEEQRVKRESDES